MYEPSSSTFAVQWVEQATPWGRLGAIFRWCDTAGDLLFCDIERAFNEEEDAAANRAVVAEWRRMWNDSVMRVNSAEMYTDAFGSHVEIRAYLTKVGRTSWGIQYQIFDKPGAAGAAEPRLIARMAQVIVAVDAETHSQPTPIPHADRMKKFVTALPSVRRAPVLPEATARAPPLGSCSFTVRVTDCDSLGHVNNAIYPVLAIESLPLPTIPSFGYCHVEYIKQVLPRAPLTIDSWTCEDDGTRDNPTYFCTYTSDNQTVAKAVFKPLDAKYCTRSAKL
ncbi:hypothetical protein DIPPA_04280 [Diplonema papillatum]|nr:hypothetical protein DIPPA_04280 [Diplonema papillatum]